jgi:hypothetical protein
MILHLGLSLYSGLAQDEIIGDVLQFAHIISAGLHVELDLLEVLEELSHSLRLLYH